MNMYLWQYNIDNARIRYFDQLRRKRESVTTRREAVIDALGEIEQAKDQLAQVYQELRSLSFLNIGPGLSDDQCVDKATQ